MAALGSPERDDVDATGLRSVPVYQQPCKRRPSGRPICCKIKTMDLTYFARKYIWWQPSEAAITSPHRVIAQVMNIGTFEDARALLRQVGKAAFTIALRDARPGEFSERSWHYWHLVLGVTRIDSIPPMPVRRFG
jgi:hypothetical protein